MSDGTDDVVEQVSQEVAADFRELLEKLRERYHFDFREYKEASLARRIRARMAQAHVDSFAAYSSFLDANPNEHIALFNTILINVTNFFRDPEAWKASLLARSRQFTPVHLKWRIFRRMPSAARQAAAVLPEAEWRPQAAAAAPAEATAPAARVPRAFEALSAAVMVIDMTDTILSWNPAAEAMFDIPIASALARKFRDLDVSYRVEGLRARIEDVKARHAVSRMDDVTFTRRNGDVVHADVTVSPLLEAYRLTGVLVYATEATEHARLKEQMARIAEQHATAIEELQSTNEELETTNEELQSTNEELETTVEELQAANSELGALNAEIEGRSAELKRVDGYHLGLLNSMEQSIFVTDRAPVVTTWNQPSERMWGLRAEQAVGRDLAALPLGDMVRMLRPALDAALKRESTVDVSAVPYTLPGGEVRKVLVRVRPLRDSVGDVIGVIGTAVSAESSAADKRP